MTPAAAALILSTLSMSPPAAASDSEGAASSVVRDFYAAYSKVHRPGGLPTPEELRQLEPFLSAGLRLLIMEAREYSARYQRQHPDEKPPFVDGDYFCSNFEGFSRFEVAGVDKKRSGYRVVVRFEYDSLPDADGAAEGLKKPKDVVRWEDTVLVVDSSGRSTIDDVEYHAPWPFANHGRLSQTLRAR
jgi:hypothetical protein